MSQLVLLDFSKRVARHGMAVRPSYSCSDPQIFRSSPAFRSSFLCPRSASGRGRGLLAAGVSGRQDKSDSRAQAEVTVNYGFFECAYSSTLRLATSANRIRAAVKQQSENRTE